MADLGTVTYTSVVWTAGDVITEAKMDNMVANDQAYDSHAAQGLLLNNNKALAAKLAAGTNTNILKLNASNELEIGDTTLAGLKPMVSSAARGDIFYLNSSLLLTRLGAGTSGQFLKTNGAGADPAWASVPVVQVVNGTTTTTATNTTQNYADTNLTATITPTSASNKILVLVSQNGLYKNTAGDYGISLQLLRNATPISILADPFAYGIGGSTEVYCGNLSTSYLDSPATTSATTYKTQFKAYGTPLTVKAQAPSGNNIASTITLIEIAV